MTARSRRRRDEGGYVLLLTTLLFASVFMGLAALGVDTARWYVELERLQKAADSAALAGVVHMPADLTKARTTALAAAARNGYPAATGTTVRVSEGDVPSELVVTISSRVANAFGASMGMRSSTMTRSATADYTAPAPMGSPCNTFGNEPPSTSGTVLPIGSALPARPFPNCSSTPQFWAAVEGPATDKVQGDRYGTIPCASGSTWRCDGGKNTEHRSEGYFWAIHVEPRAVGKDIDVQLYDPAFVQTGKDCTEIPQTQSSGAGYLIDRLNQYAPTDGVARYDDAPSTYCSGDYLGSGTAPTTTYLVREQTDTGDPMRAAVVSGCTQQFRGALASPGVTMRQWTTALGLLPYQFFNPELSRVFHQWVSLCTFRPTRAGDWFLQVRTNRAFVGPGVANTNATGRSMDAVVSRGDASAGVKEGNLTTGVGVNSFAIRAVPQPAIDTSLRDQVSVAGYSRMPILQNAANSTATFNLIRALPATRGQFISFSFYDVSDCGTSCSGRVRVIRPTDATGSITTTTNLVGCKSRVEPAAFADVTGCTTTVSNTANNGKLQTMLIPIPNDYSCNPTTLGGCWFSVQVDFNGANVSDITTWDANIGGDPVRLIE